MDSEAWQATVHGVAKSWTELSSTFIQDAEAKGRGERGLFLVRKMITMMVPTSGIFPV